MARGKARFTQSQVMLAIKAAKASGHAVDRVEIEPDGKIVVVIGKPSGATSESRDTNEWDRL
jgi:hypothetical protein